MLHVAASRPPRADPKPGAFWHPHLSGSNGSGPRCNFGKSRPKLLRSARCGSDEAWANAAKHYDEDQLTALVSLIALINAYNRMNAIVRLPAGAYQPGQWG